MKERPIIFSAPMVRALLEGRKTQTRRIVKPQPLAEATDAGVCSSSDPNSPIIGDWRWLDSRDLLEASVVGDTFRCPFGVPGDRLWVRESFQPLYAEGFDYRTVDWGSGLGYAPRYMATEGAIEWCDPDDNITTRAMPSIHMPRWASRITLEVTTVGVERLRDISEEDALAEGVKFSGFDSETDFERFEVSHGDCLNARFRHAFKSLWESIHGDEAWAANPWVWKLTFKRIES